MVAAYTVRAEVILESTTSAVTVEAESREDAHEKALEAFARIFPEAESIEVFGIIKKRPEGL